MALTGQLVPIQVTVGTQPSTDQSEFATKHYTYSDKIRYYNGSPKKIGGWTSILYSYGERLNGYCRSVYSNYISGHIYTLYGTNTRVYAVIGSSLTNITPFKTSSEAIPNSLATQYSTLVNNPISTVNGSPVITVLDSDAQRFKEGDIVYLAGSSSVGGIPDTNINGDNIIRAVRSGEYDLSVGANATSTTTGGGNSVVRSSGLINVTDNAHGLLDGDRIKIDDAVDTGGILAASINAEFIIRNVSTNTFDVMTNGDSTSAVTAGGGASTVYYQPIPIGLVDQTATQGYGAGLYGIGLYGTALISTQGIAYPRIWFFDRYANSIVMTPGNQGGLYQWMGQLNTAPVLVSNAPTQINYVFESDNILVTFGASDMGTEIENRIFASDQNDITQWTSSSTNQVYDDDIEGAGRFISHAPIDDYNLIFTQGQTYTFRYIGLPFVWEVKLLEENIGLIASQARVSAKGIVYWMGQENFYMYYGGRVSVVPANSQNEATCKEYVFNDINRSQSSKCHAWYNKDFGEIWFHYPSSDSNECNRVVVVNTFDNSWTIHTLDRTASQNSGVVGQYPIMVNVDSPYYHEYGPDADGLPLPWTLRSNKMYYDTNNFNLNAIIPDSVQTGMISFNNTAYLFPQSVDPIYSTTNPISPDNAEIPTVNSARIHQFTWSGSEIGQSWQMGAWMQEVQKGPRR